MFAILTALLFSTALSTLQCTSSQVYAKFSKQNGNLYASEESYMIKDGTVLLFTSPTFSDEELRVVEYCLPLTTNSQYTVELKDKYGDYWYNGSWLKIEGIYGNIVFKNYLNQKSIDVYTVSLYMPIMKTSTWMITSSTVSGTWKDVVYSTEGWTEVTLGSVSTPVTGTQYFRKTFTGITGMAAYELRMNYCSGIVAYINSQEVFRDNMPDGTVVPATIATGSYATTDYHGVIRPAKETSSDSSVLAVELHWVANTTHTTVDFDAFIALLAPSTTDTQCFIYSDGVSILSSSGTYPLNAFNFDKSDYLYSKVESPVTVTYQFTGSIPYVNGLRIWSAAVPESQPKSFTWSGSNPVASTDVWSPVITAANAVHKESEYTVLNGYFNSGLYRKYRAVISETVSNSLFLYEMQPMICSVGIPTDISFPQSLYKYFAKYEAVNIRPIVEEFSGCTVANLPEGLSVDNSTCTVFGTVLTVMPVTTYTMTTIRQGVTYSGTFSLQLLACAGTVIRLTRTYKYNAYKEAFTIKDFTTNDIVFSVLQTSSQSNNQDWNAIVCLTGTKYVVTTSSSDQYWSPLSLLYIRSVLSGNEMETIARINYETKIGMPSVYNINIGYVIPSCSQWHYKMGTISTTWTDSSVIGWDTAIAGSIPASTNQLQFYKKIFDVASITSITGFVMSLRYKYGCVVYLNGIEAFRNGLTGDITTTSAALNMYNEVKFRQISLPIISAATSSSSVSNFIRQGSNTIAIGLVAIAPTQTTSVFDCALRLMVENSESRSFDYSITFNNMYGNPMQFLVPHYSYNCYYSLCKSNNIDVKFDDDRREWISSIDLQLYVYQSSQQVRVFDILGRNSNSEEWTPITSISGLTWSLIGQNKKLWLGNTKTWNQYRFQNFGTGDSTSCSWKFGRIDLIADDLSIEVPPLSYSTTTIVVYQNIEMGEIYSSSSFYSAYTITPSLPQGITLDTSTGMISGTCKTIHPAQNHVITAKKITGESVSVTISFKVSVCFGGVNLITLVARTDSWPSESSYRLYEGKGTTGSIVSQIDKFSVKSALNYGDFCVPHGIYTLQLRDTRNDGWSNPAGYYLTVDLGTMIFEMGQVAKSSTAPTLVTTMFSSYLPFQINFDTWKVWSSATAVDSAWKDVSYDDKDWREVKAADIGKSEAVTVYIRKAINIPSIDDYQVLNVRMCYAGGVAVYFNGHIVSRFNLAKTFDKNTFGLTNHDMSKFSKFHVIVGSAGGVEGANVISFEVHRPDGETSAIPVAFDATGVFGVNDCSILVDSFSQLEGSPVKMTDLDGLVDLNPVSFGYQPNEVGTFIEWTVENLEGSIFNSFAMQTVYARVSYGFSIYGRKTIDEEMEEKTPMFAVLETVVKDLQRTSWAVPVGMASFRQIRFEVDDVAGSAVYVSSYMTEYCKVSGSFCPAVDDYPAVAEGQISPGMCAKGFRGYSLRLCKNSVLGAIDNSNCMYKKPTDLTYISPKYTFVLNVEAKMDAPTYNNIITNFALDLNEYLPEGLILDPLTGVIKGVPTQTADLMPYTIYGSNKSGTTPATISISVRKGECKAESIFDKTHVNEIAVYQCALQGNYVGTQQRACILGKEDGEWQKATGTCVSIYLIVLLVFVAIIFVVVIVVVIVRRGKSVKPVGGIKAKKRITSTEKQANQKPTKAIKV